jgi:galactofuranose transport system permease protein
MPADGPRLRRGHHLGKTAWPPLVLVLLVVVNAIVTPGFGAFELKEGRLHGALVDVLHRGTPVMLLALGMTLVIGAGGIDLSVGAVMAIVGAVVARLLAETRFGVAAAVLSGCGLGLALGLWNGALVRFARLQPIVATLILLTAGRGIAQLVTDGQKIPVRETAFGSIANGTLLLMPATVWITMGFLALVLFVARGLAAGLCIEALGDNERAARLAGVPVGGVTLFVYAASGLLAAVAGVVVTSDTMEADVHGTGLYLELDAILAVAIGGASLRGGRMNPVGSVTGALIVQVCTTAMLLHDFPPHWMLVAKASAVLLVCLALAPALQERVRTAVRSSHAG